jgi:hypothetical protein
VKNQYRIQEWVLGTKLVYTPQRLSSFLFFKWWTDILPYHYLLDVRGFHCTVEKAKQEIDEEISKNEAMREAHIKSCEMKQLHPKPRNIPYEN